MAPVWQIALFAAILVFSTTHSDAAERRGSNNQLGPNYLILDPVEGSRMPKTPEIEATEEMLGITVELERFYHANSVQISYMHVTSIDPSSRIAAHGVKVGDIVSYIRAGGQYDTGRPERADEYSWLHQAKKYPYFHLTFSRKYLAAHVATVKNLSANDRSANFGSADAVTAVSRAAKLDSEKPWKKYTMFRAYQETSNGVDRYIVQPDSGALSDPQRFFSSLGSQLRWPCRNGCDLHISDERGTGVLRYRAAPALGRMTYYRLDDQIDLSVAENFSANFLIFLHNLSINDLDAIKLTSGDGYFEPIARLYYHFAVKYGELCADQIGNMGGLVISSFETDGYGNTKQTGSTVLPVEASFEARARDYAKWYVHGLVQYRVRSGVGDFIEFYGCRSPIVANVRKNLELFGLNHTEIRNGKGF